MPVTPREALGDKPAQLRRRLEELKVAVDTALKLHFDGSNTVSVNVDYNLETWIVNQILNVYRTAGWTVTHRRYDDQRDGSYATFSFTAIVPMEKTHIYAEGTK